MIAQNIIVIFCDDTMEEQEILEERPIETADLSI